MRSLLFALLFGSLALAADAPRKIPPPGIAVPDEVRAELTAGAESLAKEIALLKKDLAERPELLAELPNVEIFHKAVDWALRYDEFFDAKQFDSARGQLQQGHARAAALRKGETPWNQATGLVLRAYRSEIDDSIQPYGMVIPEDWKPGETTARRLDFWLRGRSEKGTELPFIDDRQRNKGEFTPPGAFVLHPFGRYCCANKFAGETDLFEALEDARKHYTIDENRLVVRGFSMGGASTWQFATHHAGMWAAAAPGAGFAETAEFFKSFASGKEPPPWWEQVLWRWYDCTTMAANIANTSVVAYSGEIDGQKQAADIMTRYAEKEGLTFPHIIGPQTAHKYHPDAKPKIEELVTAAVEKETEKFPRRIHVTTYSLLYNGNRGMTLDGLERQWERADLDLELGDKGFKATTKNVSAFSIFPLPPRLQADSFESVIDGQIIPALPAAERVNNLRYRKVQGQWAEVPKLLPQTWDSPLPKVGDYGYKGKRYSVCGPIDHAFMSRFVFVRPTGQPLNAEVGAWVKAEMEHAIAFWRKVFRGDVPVKDDTALTPDDIQNAHLILWGDPSSNRYLVRLSELDPLNRLPVQWSADTLVMKGTKYDARSHVPIFIYPNPLNPSKYLVLNSGPTFREQALLNNSDQTPKLPDWAVIDIRTPADARWPGLVVDAGFFDEAWRMK